jgi:hypothetical protein
MLRDRALHTLLAHQVTSWTLGSEKSFSHFCCSPDLAPLDSHLLLKMKNHLRSLNSQTEEIRRSEYPTMQNASFYHQGLQSFDKLL